MTIGDRLRKLREGRELTLEAAADLVGIPVGTLTSYENDNRQPKLGNLRRLARFYGVSVAYLLGEPNGAHMIDLSAFPEEYQQIWRDLQERPDLRMLHRDFRNKTPEQVKAFLRVMKDIMSEGYHE